MNYRKFVLKTLKRCILLLDAFLKFRVIIIVYYVNVACSCTQYISYYNFDEIINRLKRGINSK